MHNLVDKNKIFILTIIFLFFTFPAKANSWKEVYPQTFVDSANIKNQGNYIYYWSQSNNDGSFEYINGKYTSYVRNQGVIDCSKNKGVIISSINYEKNGDVISSYFAPQIFSAYKFVDLPQGSSGAYISNYLCKNYKIDLKMVDYNPKSNIYHKPDCIYAKHCTGCMQTTEWQAVNRFHSKKCSRCFK